MCFKIASLKLAYEKWIEESALSFMKYALNDIDYEVVKQIEAACHASDSLIMVPIIGTARGKFGLVAINPDDGPE